MKYDTKTTKAIEESIAHHEKNLHKLETLEGEFINSSISHRLWLGSVEIKYNYQSCALCNLFGAKGCLECPLLLGGFVCEGNDSPWNKIKNSTTKSEAITATKGMIKALRGLVEEFGVGDRAECLTTKNAHYGVDSIWLKVGKVYEVMGVEKDDIRLSQSFYSSKCFKKVLHFSPHASLKARIDAITCDTSLGEVDDVMQGIGSKVGNMYGIYISTGNNGYVTIFERDNYGVKAGALSQSYFNSQPEKISALKQALTWLLDKSDLKDTCPECKGSKVCSHCEGKG